MRPVPINPAGETPDVGIPRHLAAAMTIGEQQEWLRHHLSRHPVSRRTAVGDSPNALAALGTVTAPWARAAGSQAASTPVGVIGRHLSFGADPIRQMAVAAELTAKPKGRVVVDIGHSTDYGHTVEAEIRELISMVPQQDGSIRAANQFYLHAFADNLHPGESYQCVALTVGLILNDSTDLSNFVYAALGMAGLLWTQAKRYRLQLTKAPTDLEHFVLYLRSFHDETRGTTRFPSRRPSFKCSTEHLPVALSTSS